MTQKIAVVDDDLEICNLLENLLEDNGYQVAKYSSAEEALVYFKKNLPQVLITDYKMKSIDGMKFLKKVQAEYPELVTIMMTGFGSIEMAIEAMKSGAHHYIVKPFNFDEIILLIKQAMDKASLKKQNTIVKQTLNKTFSLESILGKSSVMLNVFKQIKLLSISTANVLVTGESGSGKELVARAIHNSGSRKNKTFVPLNCTAIPEQLLESELFGHVKGSFTGAIAHKKGLFEEANGGTLFLDEIGDLSLPLQAKLLRVIQDRQIRPVGGNQFKKVDVRIISATHTNLKFLVQAGEFREDLYYRLNVVPIRVPSLRERTEDIPLLVESFIEKFARQNDLKVKGIEPEALAVLMTHTWPGNVRELENIIERTIVLSRNDRITKNIILDSAFEGAGDSMLNLQEDRPTLEKLEERYIKLVLNEVKNKKEDAAKILGISRRTLYRREKLYDWVTQGQESYLEEQQESFN